MKNKISVAVYGSKQYGENKLTEMILNKDFGFEFSIESETEKNRRIFSFEEIMGLKKSIDEALKDYEYYSKHFDANDISSYLDAALKVYEYCSKKQ